MADLLVTVPLNLDECRLTFSCLSGSELPSIFCTVAITIAGHGPSSCITSSSSSEPVSRAAIAQLGDFFKQKLLYFVPVISNTDVENFDSVIDYRPALAYSIAFVAARFVLGYGSVRLRLMPHMLDLLQVGTTGNGTGNGEWNWTDLQARAVLYAYAQAWLCLMASQKLDKISTTGQCLNPWIIKLAIENMALQLSLHRSIDDLNMLRRNNEADLSLESSYRSSVFWPWLFTMSRQYSTMARTPPSILNDSTINRSLSILKHSKPNSDVRRIIAEAELYGIWDQASFYETGLAERWCRPPGLGDASNAPDAIKQADALLQTWKQEWLRSDYRKQDIDLDPTYPEGAAIDFHYRLVRFHIYSFAIPVAFHQFGPAPGLGSSPQNHASLALVVKSAEAASDCCYFLRDLNRLQREYLRYISDFGFTMLTLCCLYIMHAHDIFSGHPVLAQHIAKVEEIAHLMEELVVGSNLCPRIYGQYILSRLQMAGHNDIPHPVPDYDDLVAMTNSDVETLASILHSSLGNDIEQSETHSTFDFADNNALTMSNRTLQYPGIYRGNNSQWNFEFSDLLDLSYVNT
ncbi:hypothetical protein FQN55_000261 [Onygenales sp. PD_40]|nr:hypothetical protein FQN55_000261 [Onygenales sp. PD_40]